MNEMHAPPPLPAAPRAPRRSPPVMLKMGIVAALVLALLIPLQMIRSVLSERLQRRDSAIEEITSTWGHPQVVTGPALIVPYRYTFKTWKEQIVAGRVERTEVVETAVARAFFLPKTLEVDGDLAPDVLYRGIYRAVVYRGRLALSGEFAPPAFEEWKVRPEDILWEDAVVALGVSDLRGAPGALALDWGGRAIPLTPGARAPELAGVEARLRLDGPLAEPVKFRVDLTLKGSHGLRLAPVGESTTVKLASTWPDPSFQGAFLPTERTVAPEGFSALWQVSYYGRGYPQQWTDRGDAPGPRGVDLTGSLLGVDLISLLDVYRYVERSTKYGALFIALVFTAFFLFEALARVRVHPFQYTLVGAALCLFYLALLSLSEFLSFGRAYAIGAAAATLLIAWYSAAALKSGRRSALLAAGIALTYGFLYVILRLQDYSLLLGTAGLFLVLGLVMWATRRMDWYAREE